MTDSVGRPVNRTNVAAVVAAAGRSLRMGQAKQLLPWGNSTVIATVVSKLHSAGAEPVVCVVGHRAEEMRAALQASPAVIVENRAYVELEMLRSYQEGIRFLQERWPANQEDTSVQLAGALLALGDQPHLPVEVIAAIIAQAAQTPDRLVIPSYQMRRGHPFFVPATLWPELLDIPEGGTLRDLVRRRHHAIVYVETDTDAILRDIDTPADYDQLRTLGDGGKMARD
jgi:molybdenum cofactor cytidylyltransferase